MKKRVIAALLILLLLVMPNVSGVFGSTKGNTASTAASTEAAVTDEATTETPVTEAPETEAPETEAPETEAPETEAPETEAPETEAPETEAPETEAPETEAPETEAPETEAPETEADDPETTETETPETEAPESGLTLPAEGGQLESGRYVLTEDTTLTGKISVAEGAEVEIDLEGKTLTFDISTYMITNKGSLTIRNGSLINSRSNGIESWGVLKLQNVDVTAVNYTLDLYTGTVEVGSCRITATKGSNGMAVYTNSGTACTLTVTDSTLKASVRAFNQWGTGTASFVRTTFIGGDSDPEVVELNKGNVTLSDNCALYYKEDQLAQFKAGSGCNFVFDPTTKFDGRWSDYFGGDWIAYVKAKYTPEIYPDGIPATEYVQDDETKTIHIYTADGLAWWAYQLTGLRTDFKEYRILLEQDVDLDDHIWRATLGANFVNGVFDGQNHTIRNLHTKGVAGNGSGTVGYGFLGDMSGNSGPITVKNVTFDSASVDGQNGGISAGVVFGALGCDAVVENVHIKNAYTRAHKSGAIAGAVDDGAKSVRIVNCSVEDTKVSTPNVHIRAGGMIGCVEIGSKIEILNSHVSHTTIDASFYAGGLIGVVEHSGAEIILDPDTYVEDITVACRNNLTELHTVTVDGATSANTRTGGKNAIVDGWYLDGGKYSGSLKNYYWGGYAEFYIMGPPPSNYDAKTYLGFTDCEHYGDVVHMPIANLELTVGSHNYDYTTHTTKSSVIYYAVYSDGVTTRDVLYGYEYVTAGETAAGRTLYGDLDCTGVTWYTDEACTAVYDRSTPVTEGLTLYTPLVMKDQDGVIPADRLVPAGADALPQVKDGDGVPQTCRWVAVQKGTPIETAAPAAIPDMTLELYTSVDVLKRTLTITRETDTADQDFWYTVSSPEGDAIRVAIQRGSTSVTITGLRANVNYTVTEENSWSWRYSSNEEKTVRFEGAALSKTVSFSGTKRITRWLSGLAELVLTKAKGE